MPVSIGVDLSGTVEQQVARKVSKKPSEKSNSIGLHAKFGVTEVTD
jgi:hypothetical protein